MFHAKAQRREGGIGEQEQVARACFPLPCGERMSRPAMPQAWLRMSGRHLHLLMVRGLGG